MLAPIPSFLVILYGLYGVVIWGTKKLPYTHTKESTDFGDGNLKNVVTLQQILVASSMAIRCSATVSILTKLFELESLLTPSLMVGNVSYTMSMFVGVGLLLYKIFQ